MRIDKWLWAARFYKTRSIATRACELNRVSVGGQPVKPARDMHVGDRVRIKNESGDFDVEILGLSEMRGPASVAQTLYRETEESREQRLLQQAMRKAMLPVESTREGRPNKRDRREIAKLRGR